MSTANAGIDASLCLIDNSPVAAIQQARAKRSPPALSGVSIDYFAARPRLLHHLKREYGLNPIRFTKDNMPSRAFDSRHRNEEYGYIILCAILRGLHEMLGGRILAEEREWQSRLI